MNKKLFLFLPLILVFSSFAYADTWGINSTFKPWNSNVTYVFDSEVTCNTLSLGARCLNITGGNSQGQYCIQSIVPINLNFSKIFNLNIFYLENRSLVNQTVNISMIGLLRDYNFNENLGIVLRDDIEADEYGISLKTAGYSEIKLFKTKLNASPLQQNVYFTTGLTQKDFIVRDNIGNLVSEAKIEFFQNVNGTLFTIQECLTDFSGRCQVELDEDVRYNFRVTATGHVTKNDVVRPTESEYAIVIDDITSIGFVTIWDDAATATALDYVANSTNGTFILDINSIDGDLEYYGIRVKYNNTFTTVNNTNQLGERTTLGLTNINPVTNSTAIAFYFFKLENSSLVVWNQSYFFPSVVGKNLTLESGIFDSLPDSAKSFIPAFVGTLIIIILVIATIIITRNQTASGLAGAVAAGIAWKYFLFPRELLIITIIVTVSMILADIIGGR